MLEQMSPAESVKGQHFVFAGKINMDFQRTNASFESQESGVDALLSFIQLSTANIPKVT